MYILHKESDLFVFRVINISSIILSKCKESSYISLLVTTLLTRSNVSLGFFQIVTINYGIFNQLTLIYQNSVGEKNIPDLGICRKLQR